MEMQMRNVLVTDLSTQPAPDYLFYLDRSARFVVVLEDNKKMYEYGRTKEEAIGKLILANLQEFAIHIVE